MKRRILGGAAGAAMLVAVGLGFGMTAATAGGPGHASPSACSAIPQSVGQGIDANPAFPSGAEAPWNPTGCPALSI